MTAIKKVQIIFTTATIIYAILYGIGTYGVFVDAYTYKCDDDTQCYDECIIRGESDCE